MTNYKLTDDLSRVTDLDWVEGVGDVSTHYEVKFFRAFEAAKRKMIADIRNAALDDVRKALSHIRFQEEDLWFIEAAQKKIESLRTKERP